MCKLLCKALVVGHVIEILAHNHMQFCQKTQRQCNRTCYTLEGGTIESQIFCVCIPWSSYHTCLGQTWWSRVSCHENQPEGQRATSKKTIRSDFMVSHAANDENWGLRGWERGYTSLVLIPDRGHQNGTTAWCTHHHMSKCSESSLHTYTEMRPLCVVSWLKVKWLHHCRNTHCATKVSWSSNLKGRSSLAAMA